MNLLALLWRPITAFSVCQIAETELEYNWKTEFLLAQKILFSFTGSAVPVFESEYI